MNSDIALSNFQIIDPRDKETYKQYTYTGFNKNQLLNGFNDYINKKDLTRSLYTGLELLCSDMLEQFISKVIKIISYDINVQNPKISIFLKHKLNEIDNIVNLHNEPLFELRNNQELRGIICEIVTVLCNSNKNPYKIPKILESSFDFKNINEKLIAKDKTILKHILKDNDPYELYIPINELINHIYMARNINMSNNRHTENRVLMHNNSVADPFFWLSWIIEWEKRVNSRSSKDYQLLCHSRTSELYDNKHSRDMIWLLWDVIIYYGKTLGDDLLFRIIKNNFHLYCYNFTKSKKNDRKYLLYNCIMLIITNIDKNIDVYNDYTLVLRSALNCNFLILQLIKDANQFVLSKKDELLNQKNKIQSGGIMMKKYDTRKFNTDEYNNIKEILNSNKVAYFDDENMKKNIKEIKEIQTKNNKTEKQILNEEDFNSIRKIISKPKKSTNSMMSLYDKLNKKYDNNTLTLQNNNEKKELEKQQRKQQEKEREKEREKETLKLEKIKKEQIIQNRIKLEKMNEKYEKQREKEILKLQQINEKNEKDRKKIQQIREKKEKELKEKQRIAEKIKKEKNLLNSVYYHNELSNNIKKTNLLYNNEKNEDIAKDEPTKEIKLKNIKSNMIYDDSSYIENKISRIPNSNDEILEHVNKYKNNDNFCKDEIVDIIRDNKLNNDNIINNTIQTDIQYNNDNNDNIDEYYVNKLSNDNSDNIINTLFIKQENVDEKVKCIGIVGDNLYDEKLTSFSNSTHKVIFMYNEKYYPLLIKKYTQINKTFIPIMINELKDIFGIYKLNIIRFCLKDIIDKKEKKYYYLGYIRNYPDKYLKIDMIENLIINNKILIHQLLELICFRWVLGTNDSNYKTLLVQQLKKDSSNYEFELQTSSNQYEYFNFISIEENSLCIDNKINFSINLKKRLNEEKDYIELIFKKWNQLLNTTITKENIYNIFKKYMPSCVDYDYDLKIMYIIYKIKNYKNIYKILV